MRWQRGLAAEGAFPSLAGHLFLPDAFYGEVCHQGRVV